MFSSFNSFPYSNFSNIPAEILLTKEDVKKNFQSSLETLRTRIELQMQKIQDPKSDVSNFPEEMRQLDRLTAQLIGCHNSYMCWLAQKEKE
jgi:uncharacterized protein involved in exopolysaccharide biosynthesis